MKTPTIPSIAMLAVLVACALAFGGCATATPEVVQADPSLLRVGVSPDAPPLIYKQNEKITGLEAEMAATLAEHLQKTAVLVSCPLGSHPCEAFI